LGENGLETAKVRIMSKIKVTREEIRSNLAFRQRINEAELEDIEYFENGRKVEFSQEEYEDWIFTGLNNFNFFADRF
jgi:hypothetical protein